jgi:two-component system nitrogen regulation sensor histidine kinase NtrY
MLASAMTDMPQSATDRRFALTPAVELLVLGVAIAVGVASYFAIAGADSSRPLIAPSLVASVLLANLVAGSALLMLLGRRIARRRALKSPIGGKGQLHVRLVAIFSVMAAVPMLLVTIFASLLFQYGVQFWYSDRARGVFENATALTQTSYKLILQRWEEATVTMGDDLATYLREAPIDTRFADYFGRQVYYRSLSEGALFRLSPRQGIQTLAVVNPYEIDFQRFVTPPVIARLKSGQRSVVIVTGDRIQTFAQMPGTADTFLYAGRISLNPGEMTAPTTRALAAQADYRALLARARSLQLRFNAALLLVSLLIVGVATAIALAVADRLVRPVAELVDAARRVEGGDLTARVPDTAERDEVGTLASAFNRMTERLEAQNGALVAASAQSEGRRALIEAVMAGVSAGVISIAADRVVRIINSSAQELLGLTASPIGRRLVDIAPELDKLLDEHVREAIVQVQAAGEARTLAVRIARDGTGPILTFDDITQQLLDQRRAAWADVARRIAHEIKNPLTPIQLAAERLQRRYGGKIPADDGTFARLTETIVRQVGDIRRMVDEFSSFARMPKPVFRSDSLVDVARQALFLHEVAHPTIDFALVAEDAPDAFVMDRRQIGQALTNIVKNAVEAIEAKGEHGGQVTLTLGGEGARFATIVVSDTGAGLPADRDRIIEPYVTTRARGTGLGLAIVKKIVEEHFGTIAFADRPGGGAIVTMTFDTMSLAACDAGDPTWERAGDGQLEALTRYRN